MGDQAHQQTCGEGEVTSKEVEGYMPSQLLDLMDFNRNDAEAQSGVGATGYLNILVRSKNNNYFFKKAKKKAK